MKQLLIKAANRFSLLSLLGIVLLFNLFLFPSLSVSSNGKVLLPLDLRLHYNSEDVQQLLTELGESGRLHYANGLMIFDTIYPIVYTALLILILVALIQQLQFSNPIWKYLVYLPIGIFIADLLENINTIGMIKAFPSINNASVKYGSLTTSLKWTLVAINLLLIILLGVKWILRSNAQKARR